MESLLKKIGRAASFGDQGDEASRELVGAAAAPLHLPAADSTGDEMTKRFKSEATTLSVAFSAAMDDHATAMAALKETLWTWEQRLVADAKGGGPRQMAPALRAFIHSKALESMLEALLVSAQFDSLFRDAAAAVAAGSYVPAAAAGPASEGEMLAHLLLQTSTAPPALLSELLSALAGANDAADKCRSGVLAVHGVAAEEDTRWVLRVIAATLTDAREADALEISRLCEALERLLAAAKASQSGKPDGQSSKPSPTTKLSVGSEVWACWPGDGCWYRAHVKSSSNKCVQVTWLHSATKSADGCDAEEYLAMPGSIDDLSFTELGRSAVVPVADAGPRPRPASGNDLSHEHWRRCLSAAEEHDSHFRELRSLCSQLESLRRSCSAGAAPAEQEPPLCGAASTLLAFRTEAEERAETLGGIASATTDEAQVVQAEIASSTGAMETELQAVRAERSQMTSKVDRIRSRREEILQQLREVSEELTSAEAACGSLNVREQRLYAQRAQATEELMQKFEAAREQADIATQRQNVLTLAAGASRAVEEQLAARAASAVKAASARQGLAGREQAARAACLASHRAQRRELRGLLTAWNRAVWGPEAVALAQRPGAAAALRRAHQRALEVVDGALRAAEQTTAAATGERGRAGGGGVFEGLFGHGESEDDSDDDAVTECMSRFAPRYRRMRQQLSRNLERLAELEARGPGAHKPPASGVPAEFAASVVASQEPVLFSGSPAA